LLVGHLDGLEFVVEFFRKPGRDLAVFVGVADGFPFERCADTPCCLVEHLSVDLPVAAQVIMRWGKLAFIHSLNTEQASDCMARVSFRSLSKWPLVRSNNVIGA
jgi:hypothetical protein